MLLLAALFALMQLATVEGRDTPDSKNYVSYALSLTGADKREAAAATIDHYCAGKAAMAHRAQNVDVVRFHARTPRPGSSRSAGSRSGGRWRPASRPGTPPGTRCPFMPERFMRIFEVRPGYPLVLAPFVALLGVTWGVWAAGVVITCAGGVLAYLVLRTLAAPVPLALTGMALYLVLPSGTTAMRPMTEGLMLALTLAALWGCALVLGGTRPPGGPGPRRGALLALFTVKHSQALFLGACLAAAGVAVAVRRRWRGMPAGARSRGARGGGVRGGAGHGAGVPAAGLPVGVGERAGPAHRPLRPAGPGAAVGGVPPAPGELLDGVGTAAAVGAVLRGGAGGGRAGGAAAAGVRGLPGRGGLHGNPQPGGAPGHQHLGRPADHTGLAAARAGVPLLLEPVLRRAVVPAQGAPVEPVG